MHRADVAIVGAGIAGASLAWQLAGRRSVLLLEAEAQPGLHSTGRSAAMFMASYGPPQVRALTRASRAFLAAPPPGFAAAPIVSPRGALYVGWSGDEARLDALAHELAAPGVAIARNDAAAARALVPVLRTEGLIGAVHERDALDIDVDVLHQGFLRGARRTGTTLWTDAALQSAHHDGTRWTLQIADGRRAEADLLVNAAGAWADPVATLAGVAALGVQPLRRSAFVFEPPEGVDCRAWPCTAGVAVDWYFKPDAGLLLGSPANADPVHAHDVMPEELDIATAIARLEERTTLAIRRPRRTWAGLRSFAPDGELLIGFDTAQPAFFWLAGQGGYGIQSCVGASALAASQICADALPDALRGQGVESQRLSPGRWARI